MFMSTGIIISAVRSILTGKFAKLRGLSLKSGGLLPEFNGKFGGFALSLDAADQLSTSLSSSIGLYDEGVQRRFISLADDVSFNDAAEFVFNQIGGESV